MANRTLAQSLTKLGPSALALLLCASASAAVAAESGSASAPRPANEPFSLIEPAARDNPFAFEPGAVGGLEFDLGGSRTQQLQLQLQRPLSLQTGARARVFDSGSSLLGLDATLNVPLADSFNLYAGVERQLMERQEPNRRMLGREKFIERIWQWKEESGGIIAMQTRRLGASVDWSRDRFTMDEGCSAAVSKVFVDLYDEVLIYRGKRLVNWDPHFETAISDLEVENTEVPGHMWHFKYPLAGGVTYEYIERDEDGNELFRETRDYISIATTRPELLGACIAVVAHPDDERYQGLFGKHAITPLYGARVPIVAGSAWKLGTSRMV